MGEAAKILPANNIETSDLGEQFQIAPLDNTRKSCANDIMDALEIGDLETEAQGPVMTGHAQCSYSCRTNAATCGGCSTHLGCPGGPS